MGQMPVGRRTKRLPRRAKERRGAKTLPGAAAVSACHLDQFLGPRRLPAFIPASCVPPPLRRHVHPGHRQAGSAAARSGPPRGASRLFSASPPPPRPPRWSLEALGAVQPRAGGGRALQGVAMVILTVQTAPFGVPASGSFFFFCG